MARVRAWRRRGKRGGSGRHGCQGKRRREGIKREIRIRLTDREKEAVNEKVNE